MRVFHWLFALAFGAAWLATGDPYLHLHVFAGYVFGALLVFRVFWGFVGGGHARFARFLYSPRQALDYLRSLAQRRPSHFAGHNPAGSWAVYLILSLAALLVITGLLTLGGQEQAGPLTGWLDYGGGASLRELHELAAWLLTGVVGAHVAGVLLGSLAHRENLVRAMFTGRKSASEEADVVPRTYLATAMLATLALGAGIYFYPVLATPPAKPYLPYQGPRLPDNATWRAECGACHLAFQPGMLPARSWRRMLAQQNDHFGEDLFLGKATLATLEAFLTANAAERQATEAAWYVNHTTPSEATPLRITRTPYWQHKHASLPDDVWARDGVYGKSDCAACHLDAAAGTFRDGAMQVPHPTPAQHASATDISLTRQESNP